MVPKIISARATPRKRMTEPTIDHICSSQDMKKSDCR